MMDKEKDQEHDDQPFSDLSRREFVTLSLAVGLGSATRSAMGTELPVIETNVDVKTPDAMCDAVFFHPTKGSHPGVLVWPDSGGLRPAFREVGKRMAAEGYSVLVPNHLYRMAKAPVFPETFDPIRNGADAELYRRITAPFFARHLVAHRRIEESKCNVASSDCSPRRAGTAVPAMPQQQTRPAGRCSR